MEEEGEDGGREGGWVGGRGEERTGRGMVRKDTKVQREMERERGWRRTGWEAEGEREKRYWRMEENRWRERERGRTNLFCSFHVRLMPWMCGVMDVPSGVCVCVSSGARVSVCVCVLDAPSGVCCMVCERGNSRSRL